MDMRALMKQAQQMQKKMQETQEALQQREVSAEVAGGQVTAVVNGAHELVSLTIRPEVVDPQDVEFLQDMILSAVNEANRKIDAVIQEEMGAVTGGMGLPGLPGM